MAESKRTFQSAKMDKDIDDRLLPPGTYRDALNVSVEFSEDGNVGALENLKGNELLANQDITGLSSSTNPNAKVIGSIAHPEENKIYYFVTGDKSDGIFEYDASNGNISTIIIETSEAPPTPEQLLFEFSDGVPQASVAINGDITVTAQRGQISSISDNFGATVSSTTERKISAKIKVPADFDNAGEFVYGELTANQQPIVAPPAGSIQTLEPTNITSTSVKLNGKYTQDAASLTDVGFYYTENTGGSSSLSFYSNKFVITKLVGGSANISSGAPLWTDPFDTVASSDVTVIDGDGNTVSSSNYTYERYSGPQPSSIKFSGTPPTLPITVAQTSTLTSLTNALTASQIATNGTQVSLSSAITSPFSSSITGLTASTKYAFVSYAVNASGTSYGDVVTFETEAATYNVLPNNKIFIFPAAGDAFNEGSLYPGYREFEKDNGGFYFSAVATDSSGLYANYNNLASGVTWSNTGPTTLTFSNTESSNFGKANSVNTTTTTNGVYTVTAAKSGLTSGTAQIVKGSPSGTRYKSTFTLNFAKTGTGTVPFVAAFDHALAQSSANPPVPNPGLHWNASPSPTAVFSIGPFEQNNTGYIMIPLSTDNTVTFVDSLSNSNTTARFNSATFDPTKLDVSITGKTEGTDYEYYIAKETMGIWGSSGVGPVPAVIIEADPYTLNGGTANVTHTLNITYNY